MGKVYLVSNGLLKRLSILTFASDVSRIERWVVTTCNVEFIVFIEHTAKLKTCKANNVSVGIKMKGEFFYYYYIAINIK